MKVKALNSIKHGGKLHRAGEVLDVSKKDAEYLLSVKAAVAVGESAVVEYDGEALFQNTEDFSTLKVAELKAICVYMELPTTGNKDELIAAIEAESEEVLEDDVSDETKEEIN